MTTRPITRAAFSAITDLETTERGVRPHRLPLWVRQQFPDPQVLAMEAQPSGVRLSIRTRSTRIELVSHALRASYAGADRPRGRIDLLVDGTLLHSDTLMGGDIIHTDLQSGATEVESGAPHVSVFRDQGTADKEIEIWLPHNEAIELISWASDAPISPAPRRRPRWVHHGSSISHGSNATGPTGSWPAVAAQSAGVDLRNLGLGGSALLDPFMARVIRDAPADVISAKIGINIVNFDSMRLRAFVPALHGFLDTIRDGHPTTPILLVSPIFCGIHENAPGPVSVDVSTLGTDRIRFTTTGDEGDTRLGRLTLRVIRDAMRTLVTGRQDTQLHYVDGLSLYGPDDAGAHPLPDAIHPDTETHALIGDRFARSLSMACIPEIIRSY